MSRLSSFPPDAGPPPGRIEALAADGARLVLDFTWQGDRYAHRLSLDGPDGARLLCESVEGDSAEEWPPSPAFQQLLVEPRGASAVALLVGMSGASHWSASIEPVPGSAAFLFDVACRIKRPPVRLGSRYSPADSQAPPNLTPESPAEALHEPRQIGVGPTPSPALDTGRTPAFPVTLRWRYRIGAP